MFSSQYYFTSHYIYITGPQLALLCPFTAGLSAKGYSWSWRSSHAHQSSPCLDAKFQILNFFSAAAWRLKSRKNKKRIATAACKSRDESNEPN